MRGKSQDPRANREITASEVRLIDENGEMLGVMPIEEALERADKAGLDLIEISPNMDPPVCKILDFGKYKYQAQKRAHDARKKQKVIAVKEIKIRPNIGEHDYQVKLKQIHKFIGQGDKVKVSLRFRGREMTHQEVALELFQRIESDVTEIAKVEVRPKLEGRIMVMILVSV